MPTLEDHQREAARVMLDAVMRGGFALAGSSALREHGISRRPTADVDLFTASTAPEAFAEAVEAGVRALRKHGLDAAIARRADQFARLAVTTPDGYSFDVDMGVDWRAHAPVRFAVGPVLDVEDAVANKVGALYSRGEARDFLDVDAIRRSGRFTDGRLIASAINHDPGFDIQMFARQLALVDRVSPEDVAEYGYTAEDLAGVQRRLRVWLHDLRSDQGSEGGSLPARGAPPPKGRVSARQAYRMRTGRPRGKGLER